MAEQREMGASLGEPESEFEWVGVTDPDDPSGHIWMWDTQTEVAGRVVRVIGTVRRRDGGSWVWGLSVYHTFEATGASPSAELGRRDVEDAYRSVKDRWG